ncbi:MAG: hypothetical protein E7464_06940 [Ruminococcaceae bacterium]|nr:hypothetical protein [Oscillospiraceae bacterium]
MSEVRGYLLTIVGASFLVSLVCAFPQKKGIKRVVTLCCGLFLLLTLVRPILSFRFGDLSKYLDQYQMDDSVIHDALEAGQNESARLITEQTVEYILDKATALGASIHPEVTLASLGESYQYPYSVTISGHWTPQQKQELTIYISQTLGIPEERQLWSEDNS